MSVAMNVWILAAIIIFSLLTGFLAGRSGLDRYDGKQEEEPGGKRPEESREPERGREPEGIGGKAERGPQKPAKKDGKQDGKHIPLGWAVGSPAAGEVDYFYEGSRRGAAIRPDTGALYAPAAGKIVKVYPTGNAMRLRTDFGVELLIRAGVRTEELEGLYFRPRVVQNEVVRKGKLLLEYDLDAVSAAGYDPTVTLSLEETENFRDFAVTEAGHVKNGEDLLFIRV